LNRDDRQAGELAIQKAFEGKNEVSLDDFEGICIEVLKIPKIFKKMAFERIKELEKLDAELAKLPKQNFLNYYKRNCEGVDVKRQVFTLLAKQDKNFIAPEDFKPLFKNLLETHPGLEFLQATPEFQDRYADTVVMRIFFIVDSNDDDKITWRDFKLSNLLETFFQVSNENDINVVR